MQTAAAGPRRAAATASRPYEERAGPRQQCYGSTRCLPTPQLSTAPPGLSPPACWRPPYRRPVSYTHLRAHETKANLVCRLLLEKKKKTQNRIGYPAARTSYQRNNNTDHNPQ